MIEMVRIGKEDIQLLREEKDILVHVHQHLLTEKKILVEEEDAVEHLQMIAEELYRILDTAEGHIRAFEEHRDSLAAGQIKKDIGMIDELIVPLRKYTQALKGLKPRDWEYTKKLLRLESNALSTHRRLRNTIGQ